MKCKTCELCNQQASLYCPSDSAYLCRNCDDAVHRANFLVARHLRQFLCSKCECLTEIRLSGTTLRNFPSICRSCSPENPSDDADSQLSSSSSESCTTAPRKRKARTMKRLSSSVTGSASPSKKKKIGSKSVESVTVENFEKSVENFEKWNRKCNRLTEIRISGSKLRNLPSSFSPENPSDESDSQSSSESYATAPKKTKAQTMKSISSSVTGDASPATNKKIGSKTIGSVTEEIFVKWNKELELNFPVTGNRVAVEAMDLCLRTWKLLPLKVAAATSFWMSLRFCGDGSFATCQNLMRLEKISSVPAKLILTAHSKLERVYMQHHELLEGCDES